MSTSGLSEKGQRAFETVNPWIQEGMPDHFLSPQIKEGLKALVGSIAELESGDPKILLLQQAIKLAKS